MGMKSGLLRRVGGVKKNFTQSLQKLMKERKNKDDKEPANVPAALRRENQENSSSLTALDLLQLCPHVQSFHLLECVQTACLYQRLRFGSLFPAQLYVQRLALKIISLNLSMVTNVCNPIAEAGRFL